MPRKLQYDIIITNIYTGIRTQYTEFSLRDTVKTINIHYGCEIITFHSLNRLIGNKQKPSRIQKGIYVIRRQSPTVTYKNALGSKYPPVLN
jgi:hypothetical protein